MRRTDPAILTTLRQDRPLRWILALALLLNLVGIGWGLPGTVSWNADSIAGTLVLKVWNTYTVGFHKYPYLHFWISFLVYLPFVGLWLATGRLDGGCWPFLNPRCFDDPAGQMGLLILLSRLISVAMGLGLVYAVYLLAMMTLGSRRAAHVAALATALSYAVVFYAHLGNLDLPMTFWYALSLLAFVGILGRGERRDYLRFGLFSGAALGTKEGIIGAYVLVGLSIIWAHLERPGVPRASHETRAAELQNGRSLSSRIAGLIDARMRALVFGLLFVYILSTNAVFNRAGFVDHWRQWLPGNERMDGFREQVDGWTPVLLGLWRSLTNGMGLPLVLLCLAGIAIALLESRRGRWGLGTSSEPLGAARDGKPHGFLGVSPLWLLVPCISYIAFTILPARMAQIRLVLPMVPSLAVFGALAAGRLMDAPKPRRNYGTALVVLALAHAGILSLRHDLLFIADARYEAEAWLQTTLPAGAEVHYFSDKRYLPRLEDLGFEAERIPPDADYGAELEARRPEILLLSARWYERFDKGVNADEAKRSLIEALRSGRGGYDVVWHSRAGTRPWWRDIPDEAKASPSVDPEIFILRRRP